jgi:hypothetical protein
VFAMTLCVSALIASEFMPVSLLTPIASDLHLTEGQAARMRGPSRLNRTQEAQAHGTQTKRLTILCPRTR